MAMATMATRDDLAQALSEMFSDLRVGARAASGLACATYAPPGAPLPSPVPFFRYPNGERDGVYSGGWIPRDAVLGEIEGTPRDIYEIHHTEYMLLTDSCVLDLRSDPARSCRDERALLSWANEDNETFAAVNCRLVREVRANRFYLQAVRDIAPDDAIVYSMQLYAEWCDD